MTLLHAQAFALVACAACVKKLPPAPTPQPIAPHVDAPPPAAGLGRLVVDVVDGPTPVQRVDVTSEPHHDASGRTSFALSEVPRLLCPASPCVADVPPGNILVGFPVIGDPAALEVELVHVDAAPAVYRRALSVYNGHTGALRKLGIVATSVGGTSALTGVVLLPIGLGGSHDALTTAGGITLGAGALVLAFGIWAIRHDAPTYRPGASNHFSF